MITKAAIIIEDQGNEKIEVMFNPEEYEVTSLANYNTKNFGQLQYHLTELEDFTIALFFDSYEQGTDIRNQTNKIADLTLPTVSGTSTKRPPICHFSWGGFTYRGMVKSVKQKFTMFLNTGIPVRAELTVTFTSLMTETDKTKYTGKEACLKYWYVKASDRLDLIANSAMNNASYWKLIAAANDIENPYDFPTSSDIGRRLIIPDAANLKETTGL